MRSRESVVVCDLRSVVVDLRTARGSGISAESVAGGAAFLVGASEDW